MDENSLYDYLYRYVQYLTRQRRAQATVRDYFDTYKMFVKDGYTVVNDDTVGAFLERFPNIGSRNKYLAHLTSFATWMRRGRDKHNIIGEFTLTQAKEYPAVPEVISDSDADRLIAHIRKHSVLAAAHAVIMRGTGLRFSEALNLRETSIVHLANGMTAIRFFGKARRERIVPLNPDVLEAVRTWVKKPLSAYQVRFYYRQAAKEVGLNTFKPHHFRHTVATKLRASGASYDDIGDFLGHSAEMCRLRYAVVDHTLLGKLAKTLERTL